jgi:hypothetical protein
MAKKNYYAKGFSYQTREFVPGTLFHASIIDVLGGGL